MSYHGLQYQLSAVMLLCMQLQNICVYSALCLLLLLLLARYYGQSKPWGADVRKHMAYLTAEQALAGLNRVVFGRMVLVVNNDRGSICSARSVSYIACSSCCVGGPASGDVQSAVAISTTC
jgi:hypothetical protein